MGDNSPKGGVGSLGRHQVYSPLVLAGVYPVPGRGVDSVHRHGVGSLEVSFPGPAHVAAGQSNPPTPEGPRRVGRCEEGNSRAGTSRWYPL